MRTNDSHRHLGLLLVAALVGGTSVATVTRPRRDRTTEARARAARCEDATGRSVRCGGYLRVASGSLLTDQLLDELVPRERIVAFSIHGDTTLRAHRYRDRPHLDPNGDLERLLALRPDLLLVNHFLDPGKRRRLEDAGVTVFDLGPMRGVDTFLPNLALAGRLLGEQERAAHAERAFRRRLAAVASDVPQEHRPTGAYLATYGTQIYGGTRGTSFHDVLEAAGLRDVEAVAHEGWPELTSEVILGLDPDVVVTTRGRRTLLCEHPGLSALRACRTPGAVVELPQGIADDPGFGMLDAAELLRDAVHGPTERGAR